MYKFNETYRNSPGNFAIYENIFQLISVFSYYFQAERLWEINNSQHLFYDFKVDLFRVSCFQSKSIKNKKRAKLYFPVLFILFFYFSAIFTVSPQKLFDITPRSPSPLDNLQLLLLFFLFFCSVSNIYPITREAADVLYN